MLKGICMYRCTRMFKLSKTCISKIVVELQLKRLYCIRRFCTLNYRSLLRSLYDILNELVRGRSPINPTKMKFEKNNNIYYDPISFPTLGKRLINDFPDCTF